MAKEFDGLYAKTGRPSIPPERLLRALLLQIFYYGAQRAAADGATELQPAVPLVRGHGDGRTGVEPRGVQQEPRAAAEPRGGASRSSRRVLAQAKPHLSDEHFTVDGTLIEAWASQKSFQKKDGGDDETGSQFPRREAHATTRTNRRPIPTPGCIGKANGQEAKLSYLGHVLMENRNGLIVDAMVTQADGTAERDAAC